MTTIRIVEHDKFPGFFILYILWWATNSLSFSSGIVQGTQFATGLKIAARGEISIALILL